MLSFHYYVILSMNFELQDIEQPCGRIFLHINGLCSVRQEKYKIITVSQICEWLNLVTHKSFKFVEVDIGKNLTGQVANRDTMP